MSTNIYDLANELDRAIRQLPEYQAVQTIKQSVEADSDAKAILDDYLAFQTEIQEMIQSGQLPSSDMQTKMQEFTQKIQENPLLTEYFSKQQQLSIYISDVEKIIFSPLRDLL
ncbi:YlbF/YmcA family competence regulator [Streptococcus cameli]